jgi:outer membrane protein OmpA-like peptidoglycan-associated protein
LYDSFSLSAVGALTNVQESQKELRLTLASDILFDFDRAKIRPDAKAALDRVADIIRRRSGGVRIEGFTDSKARQITICGSRTRARNRWRSG